MYSNLLFIQINVSSEKVKCSRFIQIHFIIIVIRRRKKGCAARIDFDCHLFHILVFSCRRARVILIAIIFNWPYDFWDAWIGAFIRVEPKQTPMNRRCNRLLLRFSILLMISKQIIFFSLLTAFNTLQNIFCFAVFSCVSRYKFHSWQKLICCVWIYKDSDENIG